jgi:hypothetical protein
VKDRVAPDWVVAAERLLADPIDVHLAPPADQRDDTGRLNSLGYASVVT